MGWKNDSYWYSSREIESIARNYYDYEDIATQWAIDSKVDFDMALKKLPQFVQRAIWDYIKTYDETKVYDVLVYSTFGGMAKILNGLT